MNRYWVPSAPTPVPWKTKSIDPWTPPLASKVKWLTACKTPSMKMVSPLQFSMNWNEEERGAPGKFSFQLILDDGAEEYAIRPPAEDADVLMELFKSTGTIYFDLERSVLIFGSIPLGGSGG